MPASGPGKSATVSAITGSPKLANRAGSPLAFRMSRSDWGFSRAITRWRMVRPPIRRIGLSPPPIRRARPPASSTPGVGGNSVVTLGALALVSRGFLFDESEVLIVDDALLAGQRDEGFASRAPDQGQPDLPRQIDAPGGKARARNQDRNSHPHRLDHHFGGQPPGGVENLVGRIDAVAEHPARDLVDGVVAADVFGVADQRALLAQQPALG